ncbi:hypothetical protein BaRGS_00020418 [Batillaria attramentaria]|uniref:Secreted protein n=1 Tax=Batillaria attramentaria TaxID=370345 RepID=A0ABD0KMK1_9CAEN
MTRAGNGGVLLLITGLSTGTLQHANDTPEISRHANGGRYFSDHAVDPDICTAFGACRSSSQTNPQGGSVQKGRRGWGLEGVSGRRQIIFTISELKFCFCCVQHRNEAISSDWQGSLKRPVS